MQSVAVETADGQSISLYSGSHALLIGVSDYNAGWPRLTSVPAEIETVAVALSANGFLVRKVMNPDGRALEKGFKDFIDDFGYDQGNRLLIFYSGHGWSRRDGEQGYLVPVDAPDPTKDEKGFLRKSVTMAQILTWSKEIEARHALFLFDSCFSGTIFTTKALPAQPPQISAMIAKPVREYIAAGGAGEQVPSKSVFTPCFIRAIQGDADYTKDGYVTGTELGMYLRDKVLYYNTGQTPQYGKIRDPDLDQGDFVFKIVSYTGTDLSTSKLPEFLPPSAASGPLAITLTGTLVVKSPAAGTVSIDGGQVYKIAEGQALKWEAVTVGRHSVRVVSGDKTWEQVVQVREGKALEIAATFGPKAGEPLTLDLGGGVNLELVWIAPGEFDMGSPASERERDSDEVQHSVTLTKGFWMGKTEVTQRQYQQLVGSNPSYFQNAGGDAPVEHVSWDDAKAFCAKMAQICTGQLPAGSRVALPTEAQWEYACRAGTRTPFHYGTQLDSAKANFNGNYPYGGAAKGVYRKTTVPVGSYAANAFGLYDMHGNVLEWCEDWSGDYPAAAVSDPTGPSSGSARVLRG
ncbi:MAG: SUMF1/EgtB/PvdO family nonheme iron enzyme, partial [Verrucomicrobia bacterium]|nr:SUMF1/EgtB/PvdO family nonheme iron enzyme [Verrucomicrobiota bacterium]